MKHIEEYIKQIIEKSTPAVPSYNVERLKDGTKPHWNYVDSCVLTSVLEMYKSTGDKFYFDFVDEYLEYYIDEDGNLLGYKEEDYNLDNINGGRVLFQMYNYTEKEKYYKAILNLYKQLKNQPRTIEGNFWHKLIYPEQVWLDGLYMSMPFYTMYETKYTKLENYKDIFEQITNVRKLMFNEEKGLYFHGYDSSKKIFWADEETGLSKNHWLRSIGWFAAALVDVLEVMDDQMFYEYRTIRNQFKELIDGIIKYQQESGMWYQLVALPDLEGNYLETSGSAMLAYAILKGARLDILPSRYAEFGEKAFNDIYNQYFTANNDEFSLDSICLVAGLGPVDNTRRDGTVEYYLSEPIVSNDGKGIAPFVLAYAEIVRLKDQKKGE